MVEITGLGTGGEGVGRIDGEVVFVSGALPGDRVTLVGLEKRRGTLRGSVGDVIEPSPHRVAANCPVFGECGGCTWLDFGYPAQGEWKRRIVQDCFQRIARIEVSPEWLEEPSLRLGYRTRATFHPAEAGWGFYARGSHAVVPIESCPLSHPKLNRAFSMLRGVQGTADLTITVNPEREEALIWSESEQPALKKVFPSAQAEGVAGNRNFFEFDGIPIVNGTFAQSSLLLNRLLRELVAENLGEPASLLDLYCGSGNFSLPWVAKAEVIGVDSSGPAVMAAFRKSGADYRVGNEAAMCTLIQERAWDAVLLDPPRIGAQKAAGALRNALCGRIVYVSCDPATLARDSRELAAAGWKLQRIAVVDMFPNTPHIETVSLFMR